MRISEPILLDTNVLVYAADSTSPHHHLSRTLRDRGTRGEIALCITPQVLSEYFAVITHPGRVQSPRSPAEAMAEVERYSQTENLRMIYPGENLIAQMISLFHRYSVSRQQIFDLQLVATMLSNDVTCLCTYNVDHFAHYSEIQSLTPEDPRLLPG